MPITNCPGPDSKTMWSKYEEHELDRKIWVQFQHLYLVTLLKLFGFNSPSFTIPFPLSRNEKYFPLLGSIKVFKYDSVQFQFSRSVMSDSATPWIAASQASLSIINSQSSLKLTSIESAMPFSHLILCRPLLLLPSIPPSITVFSNESTLHMSSQSTGVSALASVLPKNTQDWSPCSPRDSQESSPTPQFQTINSSALSFLHSPTLTSIHDHWKNHSLCILTK